MWFNNIIGFPTYDIWPAEIREIPDRSRWNRRAARFLITGGPYGPGILLYPDGYSDPGEQDPNP